METCGVLSVHDNSGNACAEHVYLGHVIRYRKKRKTMHVKANNKCPGNSRNSYCHSMISWREMQMRAEDVLGKIFY